MSLSRKPDVKRALENLYERLTWEQMCERHPNRWVVLLDVEWLGLNQKVIVEDGLLFSHHETEAEAERSSTEALTLFAKTVTTYTGNLNPVRPVRTPSVIECDASDDDYRVGQNIQPNEDHRASHAL